MAAKADVDPAQTRMLDGLTDEVNQHAKDLDDSWQTEAKELAKTAVPASGRAARIEAILAVPALRAQERIALWKVRQTLDVPLLVPEKLPFREMPQTVFAPSPQCIARIAAQAELEHSAVLLAVPSATLDWRQFETANAETLRRDCEEFDKRIVALQAGLHDEIYAIVPPPALGPPPKPAVTVKLVRNLPPKENSSAWSQSYRLTVSVTGGTAAEAEFCWDCDNPKLAGALELRSAGQQHHLLPGAMERIALVDNAGQVDLGLDLRKAVAEKPQDTLLAVKARALGQEGASPAVKIARAARRFYFLDRLRRGGKRSRSFHAPSEGNPVAAVSQSRDRLRAEGQERIGKRKGTERRVRDSPRVEIRRELGAGRSR